MHNIYIEWCEYKLFVFHNVGLTYFLTTAQGDGGSALISAYLKQCPTCEHVLAPLGWNRDKCSQDVVSVRKSGQGYNWGVGFGGKVMCTGT